MWIEQLYRDGVPIIDIAAHEGCSVATIRKNILQRKTREKWHADAGIRELLAEGKKRKQKDEVARRTLFNLRIIAQGYFVLSATLPAFKPAQPPESSSPA